VISISNAHLLESGEIDELEKKFSGYFDLNIIRHDKIMIQGPNRNSASLAATGDVIVSNDADDIPHPERLEFIEWAFYDHEIVMLNHRCQKDKKFKPLREMEKIRNFRGDAVFNHHFPGLDIPSNEERYQSLAMGSRPNPSYYGFTAPYGGTLVSHCHAGCPSFRKDVFWKMKWREVEEIAWDYDFCLDVLYCFNKSMITDAPLMWYNLLSSRRDGANAEDLGELYKE